MRGLIPPPAEAVKLPNEGCSKAWDGRGLKKAGLIEMAISQKQYAWMIMLVGGLVVAFGLVGTIRYVAAGYTPEHPFNFGIILGYGSHMIAGVFAVLIADHLIKIEKRLDRLEGGGDSKDIADGRK